MTIAPDVLEAVALKLQRAAIALAELHGADASEHATLTRAQLDVLSVVATIHARIDGGQ